jgi:hypothetical protein
MAADGRITAFAKCRNERLRLPAFLRHYRELGVTGFVIVDNASIDGSAEYLRGQHDVNVVSTRAPLRQSRGGAAWLNGVLAEFGTDSWCVTVDIDELLVYPGSERARLPEFTRYLDEQGCAAVMCLLLDMYPRGPLARCTYAAGDDLIGAAPYFDAAPYRETRAKWCPGVLVRGGMRERVFFPEFRGRAASLLRLVWRPKPPCLTKVPLVRWDKASRYLYANHWVSSKRVAAETGALLHVKFLQDFHQRAVAEAARGEYFRNAVEYRRYAARLDRDPDMSLAFDGSVRFENSGQLARLGLITDTTSWRQRRTSVDA